MSDIFPEPAAFSLPTPVIPVSLLNRLARERLEAAFPLCWVAGEVSNLSHASSGHVYFSLKDGAAQVRCVMFRNRAQLLGWRLANGQHLEARVLVTLYEARGDFQLNVETARRAGVGTLYEQFVRLKDKLAAEGLFASDRKRALPPFPRRIGIVTSPQAAALRDVLSTLARRAGQIGIVLYPTPVQGDGAAPQIAASIRRAGERGECDLLIVCRGGGSIEDLWAFNDENVARAIHACPLPIVSGIGHETDVTIADFVADLRAPTPTAAAEIAAPERHALLRRLAQNDSALQRHFERQIKQREQQLDGLAHRLQPPAHYLAAQRARLQQWQRQLLTARQQARADADGKLRALTHRLSRSHPTVDGPRDQLTILATRLLNAADQARLARNASVERLAAGLSHLNPTAVLARGYGIVTDRHGQIIRDSHALEPRRQIAVFLHRGQAKARVLSISEEWETVLPIDRIASVRHRE